MQKKIVIQYYLLSLMYSATGLAITSAIYANYMLKHGLNLLEINLVNVSFFTTLFICEIPTGVFADVFGRKKSFIMACIIMSIGMFVYGCSSTMTGFITAEMLCAIGSTFHSGAFQSWLVDSLKHHGYEGSCTKIFARESIFNQIGGGLGAILGSYVSVVHLSLPWFIGGIGLVITGILGIITMSEDYFVHKKLSWINGFRSMVSVTKKSLEYAKNDKSVRFVLFVTSIQVFAVMSYNMYWQPYFKSVGLPEKYNGFLFTGMYIGLAVGAYISTHIKTDGKEKMILIWSQIFTGACIIGSLCVVGIPSIALLFILHEVGRGFWKPMKSGYLHSRIPSSERATIVSFCEILPQMASALGLLMGGIVAQYFGIATAWTVSSLLLIITGLFYLKNGIK